VRRFNRETLSRLCAASGLSVFRLVPDTIVSATHSVVIYIYVLICGVYRPVHMVAKSGCILKAARALITCGAALVEDLCSAGRGPMLAVLFAFLEVHVMARRLLQLRLNMILRRWTRQRQGLVVTWPQSGQPVDHGRAGVFVKGWHFLDTAKPQHLPDYWSVTPV
jgi:hypothetical protein